MHTIDEDSKENSKDQIVDIHVSTSIHTWERAPKRELRFAAHRYVGAAVGGGVLLALMLGLVRGVQPPVRDVLVGVPVPEEAAAPRELQQALHEEAAVLRRGVVPVHEPAGRQQVGGVLEAAICTWLLWFFFHFWPPTNAKGNWMQTCKCQTGKPPRKNSSSTPKNDKKPHFQIFMQLDPKLVDEPFLGATNQIKNS